MAGFWSQVYPGDYSDPGLQQADVVEQAAGPNSPVTATQTARGGNAPTVSLFMIAGFLLAIRLLIVRGIKPGS